LLTLAAHVKELANGHAELNEENKGETLANRILLGELRNARL